MGYCSRTMGSRLLFLLFSGNFVVGGKGCDGGGQSRDRGIPPLGKTLTGTPPVEVNLIAISKKIKLNKKHIYMYIWCILL